MTTREFRIDGLFGTSLILEWDTHQNAAPMAPEMHCMTVEPGRGMIINLHPDPEEVLAFADALAREAYARIAQANEQATPMIEAAAAKMQTEPDWSPPQAGALPEWIGQDTASADVAQWQERRDVLALIEHRFWRIVAAWLTSNVTGIRASHQQEALVALHQLIQSGKHSGQAQIMERLTQ